MTTQNEAGAATRWEFDPMHTQVEFSAKHLGMMAVRGQFDEVNATGSIYPENPEASAIDVTIKAASVRTNNEYRSNDLRSANMLDAEKYPTITFKSTKIETTGQDRFLVTGDLTIKETTKSVTLNVVKYGEFNDPRMGHRIGYSAEGEINRKDFGMTHNMLLDGRWLIGDEVKIMIEGEFVEKPVS